jgi:hypothetical protein
METFVSFVIVMIMLGAVLFPIGMFMFISIGSVLGLGRPGGVARRAQDQRRYVPITQRSYDFDED